MYRIASVVGHESDTSGAGSRDYAHCGLECSVSNEERGYRALRLVEPCFYYRTYRKSVGVGLQFKHFRLEQYHFEQVCYSVACFRGNRNRYNVAAPVFYQHAVVSKVFLYHVRIGARFVHLVDGYYYRYSRSLRVADGFYRLGFYTVIGRDYQYRDICDMGSSGSHCGECFVTRSIQEHDLLSVDLYL